MRSKATAWLLTLGLLAGAWMLNQTILPDEAGAADLVTRTAVGERAETGNLAATVTRVRAARGISDAEGWSADGTWLLFDIDAEAVDSQAGSGVRLAELRIGERTFTASERPHSAFELGLVPAVPRSGTLAFEIPPDALTGTATLRLGDSGLGALRAVIEVEIDFVEIPVEPTAELEENGWTR